MTAVATLVKGTLRRHPGAYARVQAAYYGGLALLERHVIGSRLHEWRWRLRGALAAGAAVEGDISARFHPHRDLLVERVAALAATGTPAGVLTPAVLEIGCGGGANLARLAERMPEAALAGVDINTRALQAARTALAQVGARVRLAHGSASALSMLDRASVDIVITDAVLMYVGPDRISKAIGEIVRVMRRGAVLVEWHMPPGDATDNTSRTHFGHWIHDYRALFAGYGCDDVVVTPLPAAAWDDAGWRRFGALIEVRVPSC